MNSNQNWIFNNSILIKAFLILLCVNTCAVHAQGDAEIRRMQRIVRNHSPFKGSTPELDSIFNALFSATQIGIGSEMDSLLAVMKNQESNLNNASDSAVFYFNQAFYWVRHVDYEKAQENYSKAGILFKKAHLELPSLYVKAHMGNIQYFMKNVEFAYKEFEEILIDPNIDTILTATMSHNIGTLLMEVEGTKLYGENKKEKDELIERVTSHFEKAILFYRAIGYSDGYASTYSVFTNIKMYQQDFEGAQVLIDSSMQLSLRSNNTPRIAFLRIKKAMLLDTLGFYNAAIDTARLAAEYYLSVGEFNQVEHALGYVYRGHYRNGDYKKASDVQREIRIATAKRSEKQLSDALSKYQAELETGKKDLTIKEQDRELESERLKTSNRNRLLIASLFLLIASILGFLLFLQRRKRKADKEKNDLILRNKADGLKAVINAEEKERKRIAADLHDGIVQQLGGLKLGLQNVLKNDKSLEGKNVIKVLDEATSELRDLSHQMMPRALGELGLIPALEDLFDKSLGLTSIQYQFEHFGLKDRLPENIETAIFRISQELINNVIKHSDAKTVNIQLFKSGKFIIFIVEDNGKGLEDNGKNKGVGLMNISSRLDTINGQVNYEPSPGSGTLVTIKIPIT